MNLRTGMPELTLKEAFERSLTKIRNVDENSSATSSFVCQEEEYLTDEQSCESCRSQSSKEYQRKNTEDNAKTQKEENNKEDGRYFQALSNISEL